MPRQNLEYPKEARNTVVRKGKLRGVYDLTTIHTLINNSMVVHVSFSPAPEDPFPAILPMIAVMGSFDRPSADFSEPLDCYLHGYVSSRLMNLSRSTTASSPSDGKSSSATQDASSVPSPEGLPVCISAAKVDGLMVALTPNSHSYNYRSVTLFGHATPVTSIPEKLYAMELITNKVIPGRWDPDHVRLPPNGAEMSSTQILRVKVQNGSGKVRDGPPSDDTVDLGNDEVKNRVWTGIVPLKETLGEPVAGPYNKVETVPEHIRDCIRDFNRNAEGYIQKAISNVKGAADSQ